MGEKMSANSEFAAAAVAGIVFLLDLGVFGMVCSFGERLSMIHVAIYAAVQHELILLDSGALSTAK
jgi:ABC-type Fe3+ transport system permease subunit